MFQHCLSRYRNTSPNTKTLSSCLERAKYDVLKFHPMPSSSLCAHTRTQSGAHRNIHSLATQHVSVTQAQHTCHTLYPPAWTGSQPWAHCVYVYDGLSPRHWVDSRCPDCQAADCAMPWAIWSDLANDVVSGLLYSNNHACSAHKRYTETVAERNEDLEATLHTRTHTHTRIWEAKPRFASFSQLCIWLQRGIWLAWYIVFVQNHTLPVYTLCTHRLWECWCQVVRLSDKLDSLRWWRLK